MRYKDKTLLFVMIPNETSTNLFMTSKMNKQIAVLVLCYLCLSCAQYDITWKLCDSTVLNATSARCGTASILIGNKNLVYFVRQYIASPVSRRGTIFLVGGLFVRKKIFY
jgi:hypothetical protein